MTCTTPIEEKDRRVALMARFRQYISGDKIISVGMRVMTLLAEVIGYDNYCTCRPMFSSYLVMMSAFRISVAVWRSRVDEA